MSQPTTAPPAQAGPSTPATTPPATPVPLARAFAAAAVAGPVLVVASSLLWLAGLDAARLDAQFVAAPLIALGLVAICIAAAGHAPRAAAVLAVLAAVGFGAGGAGFAVDGLHEVVFDSPSLADEGGLAGMMAPSLPGLLGPLAVAAIGVLVLRTRVSPALAGWALLVAGLAFPVSRIGGIAPLALAVDLLMAAALVPLGLRLWRTGRAVA